MPATMIRFTLGPAVWCLLGLDDHGYAEQTYPSFRCVRGDTYAANEADARAILYTLKDRSAGDDFGHTAVERRQLANAATKLVQALRAAV